MFGDKKSYQSNIDRVPHRTLKSLHDELRWLYNRIMEQKEPGFKWAPIAPRIFACESVETTVEPG